MGLRGVMVWTRSFCGCPMGSRRTVRWRLDRPWFWLEGSPAILAGDVLVITYAGEKLGGTYTNGYAYPFIRQTLLSSTLPYMSQLTPFTYGIDAAGGLLPLDDGELLSEARRLGTAPLMHLSTLTEDGHFSSERAVMITPGLSVSCVRSSPPAGCRWWWRWPRRQTHNSGGCSTRPMTMRSWVRRRILCC